MSLAYKSHIQLATSTLFTINLAIYIPIVQSCNVKQIAGDVEVNAGTVVVTFSADALGTTFRCKLDKGKFKTCKLYLNVRLVI